MNHLVVGILAHVDAGKTTLSEAMLYRTGTIKKLGRVDHRDAFLDTDTLERERGITIFSKQALLPLETRSITLLDTPGHVDFSAEMERTLQVLDYAILVISGTDGVQAHTETLWKLLGQYQIPTFLFINKTDLSGFDRSAILNDLHSRLGDTCLPLEFDNSECCEEIAMCSDELMAEFLESGTLSDWEIARAVSTRKLFPCYFGSALRLDGVDEFLLALEHYTQVPLYPSDFGARVFKITRDPQGNRLSWLKITGGSLKPKSMVTGRSELGENWTEKADQIRVYSGDKFTPASEVVPGQICSVTGLSQTKPGLGLGAQVNAPLPVLEPVLTYQVILPESADPKLTFPKLKELEDEDPMLRFVWNQRHQEIHVQLMGSVQLEILQSRIQERFSIPVSFGAGSIIYKETLAEPVEGVGHFEPLRHYAETHVLLKPLPQGSGIQIASACSEDQLDRNWQRLIMTHFMEKEHLGVLTGSPITDIRIILLSGRAHVKHTEGGDFREATYRAIRMGLMRGQSILLEPWYTFSLDVPTEAVGRAMADLQRMGGEFDSPKPNGDRSILDGSAPVSTLRDYPDEVAAYTRGRGRINLQLAGYRPCHNQDQVVEACAYDPCSDLDNTPDSVFCAHGGGFNVCWDEVPDHMHLPFAYQPKQEAAESVTTIRRGSTTYTGTRAEDKELQAIFERTYGTVKPRSFMSKEETRQLSSTPNWEELEPAETYLLVDGYNIIFAWDELKELAKDDLDAARNRLINILCNYQGYKQCGVILVFDAYRVQGGAGSTQQVNNIFVVYTKQAETADTYIERTTYQLGRRHKIRVATSDGMEQTIILGHNSERISARLFLEEVEQVQAAIAERIRRNNER